MNAGIPFAGLLQRARELTVQRGVPRAAIVGAHDSHALQSALEARAEGLIEPILIGKREGIETLASDLQAELTGIAIEDIAEEAAIAKRAAELASRNDCALIVKGQIHTDVLMRAMLAKESGLRMGRRASHSFLLETPDQPPLLISDAALNVEPDEAVLLDIAKNAIALAQSIGMEARAALLSASEVPFEGLPSSMRAAAVVEKLRRDCPDAAIAGPYALDIAISKDAARRKGVEGEVAGCANILVVPNIETGNALYKMMVWRMGSTAAGIISGLRLPIALTSRSDPPAARMGSLALAICSLYGGNPDESPD